MFEGRDPEVWMEVVDDGGRRRYLSSGGEETIEDALPATYGEGTGLLVEYFENPDLTELTFASLLVGSSDEWWINPDRPLSGSLPYYRLNTADGSSSRWTGEIEIPEENAGEIEFLTAYMGGVRLWIGDELIIDDWENSGLHGDFDEDGGDGLNTGTVELEAGRHTFTLESTLIPPDPEDFYGGPLSVYWRIGDGPIRAIPATQLYPSSPVPVAAPDLAEPSR